MGYYNKKVKSKFKKML